MKHLEILPSILSFDFKNINTELKRMKDNGITYLHYDVMDGHFVSNISFGESLYKQLVPEGFKANVHLMVTNPLPHAIKFYEMGLIVFSFITKQLKTLLLLLKISNHLKRINKLELSSIQKLM